ncbi:MAG: glycine C-acetyltransferase [Planctomycetes bacterium]|nr:glycine C-acetyltransferase [Planctomycetota bacterium]
MREDMREELKAKLAGIRAAGTYKEERVLAGPQGAWVELSGGRRVLNLCSNNYLGLANDPEIIAAASEALKKWGFGLSSVRFICGTQELHKRLEAKVSGFLGTEDTILYSSCFDANGGLFETLLEPEDAVISDRLNHASIIDGIRLCKAKRLRYETNDMGDLEAKLKEAGGARRRLVATDGVFSMDGTVANLRDICDLAEKHDALVMVDDSHAVGVTGNTGRGSPEYNGVMGRVDIITGTFGKALGGASGGFTSGRKEIVEMLRQRSRPYLFSNTVSPAVAAAAIRALEMLESDTGLLDRLRRNTELMRGGMREAGFRIPEGDHAIIPVMLGEAKTAVDMAERLLEKGVYVIGFSYPVVPEGTARIRVQVSAALSEDDIKTAVGAFAEVGREMGVV